jgi:hypothetical protein
MVGTHPFNPDAMGKAPEPRAFAAASAGSNAPGQLATGATSTQASSPSAKGSRESKR